MAHAVLSPSSAHRWLSCTPSARLEQQFPDESGDAAREGTVAHALGELLLRDALGLIIRPGFNREMYHISQSAYYSPAMQEYCENYRDFVLETFNAARAETPDAVVFLEQKLDLTDFVPEGFGTGDCIVIQDGCLNIIDLKYGKGVFVSAEENKQMMLYALGALATFNCLYDINRVTMTIYQPRLDNISTFEMAVEDLGNWAVNILKPNAALAFSGEGNFQPGKHCGFCRAKATCRALADYNLELLRHDFKRADLLESEEVADILNKIDLLTDWAGAVKKHALDQALQGVRFSGWKIVEGRSVRKITDEAGAAKVLIRAGWPEDSIYNKKLVGIGAIEKLIGKKGFETTLAEFVEKPAGSPTLVPESDKRPEFNSAAVDFAEFK